MTRHIADEARDLPGDDSGPFGPTDRDWKLVRTYPSQVEERIAEVYVRRWPAMFWRVRGAGVDLSTGSGREMAELADAMARAIADGMLGPTDAPDRAEVR